MNMQSETYICWRVGSQTRCMYTLILIRKSEPRGCITRVVGFITKAMQSSRSQYE